MAILKSNSKNFKYNLKSSYKKCGFCTYRYFFNAKNIKTLVEAPFFIELLVENPYINPNQVVSIQSSSNVKLDENDLQNALTGNIIEEKKSSQSLPSFVCIRVGRYGNERKQINRFFSEIIFSAG